MTERREEFIAGNADFFAAHNCHLRFVPIGFAKTETTRSYLPAPRRNALLQQTKILLNVHYSDLPYFEWHRALMALANRCCLITETCEGFEPLVPGKHFVMAKRDDLTTCCEYYLNHEDERKAMTAAAYDFICERFTQKDNCRAFLQQIDTVFRRQSDVTDSNLDREVPQERAFVSEPAPDALAKHLSRRPAALLLSAFREDLSNLFHPEHTEPVGNGRTSIDPTETATAHRHRLRYPAWVHRAIRGAEKISGTRASDFSVNRQFAFEWQHARDFGRRDALQLRRLHWAVPEKSGRLAHCSDSRRNRGGDR